MSEAIGPGRTRFIRNDDGSISRRLHNDPAWTNHIVNADELTPWRVASLLAEAYALGFEERGILVRQAIGQAGRLG